MSRIDEGLIYSKDHEWLKKDGGDVYIGITDYAQAQLGDLVFADAEPVQSEIGEGDALGVVESVKAASDVTSPIDCVIVEINQEVLDDPARINSDPYGCWLVKATPADPAAVDALMDAAAYQAYLDGLK